MTKYPAHLYTIVIDFGPAIPFFQQHHADATRARRIFLILRDKAARAKSLIENIQLWHNNSIILAYTSNSTASVWLPPPDPDGITRIPENYPRVNASALSAWQRYGKPADMAGKVLKFPATKPAKSPKRLPSTIPAPSASPLPFKLDL